MVRQVLNLTSGRRTVLANWVVFIAGLGMLLFAFVTNSERSADLMRWGFEALVLSGLVGTAHSERHVPAPPPPRPPGPPPKPQIYQPPPDKKAC